MKKTLHNFLIIVVILSIVFVSIILQGNNTYADIQNSKTSNSDWVVLDPINDVGLNTKWLVKFSGNVTKNAIDGIVIDDGNKFIPVEIEFTGEQEIVVTPVNPYENNSIYSLKIFLNNGNRYKMAFNTMKVEKPDPIPDPKPDPNEELIRNQFLKELEQLEIKLQNVKSQKTIQELTKLPDGSWDFVYVADPVKVAAAQKEYDDKYMEYLIWENTVK